VTALRRWRPSRVLTWSLAPAAALSTALVLAEAAGWPFMRQPLQRAMARAAQVPVALEGRFHARLLWRPGLEIGHLRVGVPGGIPAPHLIDGHDVDLRWRWGDVWRWQRGQQALQLRQLHGRTLDVHLVRGADGRASWQLGGARPGANAAQDGRSDGLPRIGSLAIGDGRIAVDDRLLDTRLLILVQGEEGSDAASPGYTASASVSYRAMPLKLRARAAAALPLFQDDDDPGGSAPPVANRDSTVRIDGRIDLRDESLALRAVARPKDISPLSLRSPVTVGGTLADPVVGIDPSRLAARAAAALALGTIAAPGAALLPLIDLGSRGEGDPCASPPPPGAAASAAASAPR
jgi:uncharacterized protein involved in outer membrane biogenesis